MSWEKGFEKTKLIKLGGSCFECCDYEGIVEDMKKFIKKEFKTEQEKMKKIVKASKPTFFIMDGVTEEMEQVMDDAIYETKAQIYEDLFEKESL